VLGGRRFAEAFRRGRLRAVETPKALLCASFAAGYAASDRWMVFFRSELLWRDGKWFVGEEPLS
jgi:hypothetical protein